MKLKTKVHRGSRVIRRYDIPKTPFERLSTQTYPERVNELRSLRDSINPFELSETIDQKLKTLHETAGRNFPEPRQSPPRNPRSSFARPFSRTTSQRNRRLKECAFKTVAQYFKNQTKEERFGNIFDVSAAFISVTFYDVLTGHADVTGR